MKRPNDAPARRDDRQLLEEEVQATVDRLVSSGKEVGLQIAVFRDGKLVVDVCGGTSDSQRERSVSAGDLFFAASTAKGVLSSLAHVLAARGELDYDMPLARVWPEFAARGKADVTVRNVLMHQAGVPGLPATLTTEQLCDWPYMCSVIADERPWWPAGTKFGYHAVTFGFLLGETLQRLTGESLPDLLRRAVTGPVGIADEVYFGVPERMVDRVVHQQPPLGGRLPAPDPDSAAARAIPPGARADAAFANRRDVLRAQIPSMGTMSARAAAQLYAALLGHVDAAPLLPGDRLAEIATVAFSGHDEVMDMPSSWAFGYSVDRPGARRSRPGSTFGMLGANGSAAYADIDTGVAVAVMRNRFSPDFSTAAMIDDLVYTTYPPRA
ncbi:MAG: beta-lactamase family protein [Actinomycetota bacterium]|nr:beta-lactamase family protein [Actinomycetota bacterium]